VLLVGFTSEEVDAFRTCMLEMEADMVKARKKDMRLPFKLPVRGWLGPSSHRSRYP
jgi:hypothetical protein